MDKMDLLMFIIGFGLFPLAMYIIAKFDAESFARFVLDLLKRVFNEKQANKVSNMLGVKFVEFGVGLISGIEDNEAARDHVNEIVIRASALERMFDERSDL